MAILIPKTRVFGLVLMSYYIYFKGWTLFNINIIIIVFRSYSFFPNCDFFLQNFFASDLALIVSQISSLNKNIFFSSTVFEY
jgi:hypothetical protein